MKEESVTTFIGYQTYDVDELLSEIDEVRELNVDNDDELAIKYNYSYDYETKIIITIKIMLSMYGSVLL